MSLIIPESDDEMMGLPLTGILAKRSSDLDVLEPVMGNLIHHITRGVHSQISLY